MATAKQKVQNKVPNVGRLTMVNSNDNGKQTLSVEQLAAEKVAKMSAFKAGEDALAYVANQAANLFIEIGAGEQTIKGNKDEIKDTRQRIAERQKALRPRLIVIRDAFAAAKKAKQPITIQGQTSWKQWVEELNDTTMRNVQYIIAGGNAGLGDKDRAFESLEKGYAERSDGMAYIKADPFWDGLRSDPRYADLLLRMGLPQ